MQAREASEREAWVRELNQERSKVDQDADACQFCFVNAPISWLKSSMLVRKRIAARREDLRRRHEVLKEARRLHEADLGEGARTEETIAEERYVDESSANSHTN